MRPWKAFDFELSTPDRFAPHVHSLINFASGLLVAGRPPRSLPSWPRVTALTSHRSRVRGHVHTPKPFRTHSYEKCPRKSFGIHCYKSKGLKLPWNDTLTKIPGWGAPLLASLTCNDEVENGPTTPPR